MEPYNYKDLSDQLLAELGKQLIKHGFKFKKSERIFYRKMPGGGQAISVKIATYPERFQMMFGAGVRFDDVETFVHEDNPDMTKYIKLGSTMGTELGNYSIGTNLTWDITSKHDLTMSLPSMIEAIEKIGLRYLEKYATMETAFDAFYKVENHVKDMTEYRFMTTIALAYFLGKYDLIEPLIAQSEQMLREHYDFGLRLFLPFAAKVRRKVSCVSQGAG